MKPSVILKYGLETAEYSFSSQISVVSTEFPYKMSVKKNTNVTAKHS